MVNGNNSEEVIVVGIGASAGGLEALQEFFEHVSNNTKLAFVVIQHLSPDYKSLMNELLARYTKVEIKIVEDGTVIKPNTIYLIPPRKNMMIFHNKLLLEDQDSKKGLNLPIDIFFRSLAADKGKNAIAIVLSGTGSDGTLGIRAIKETGGMVMVQDDQTAKFDGMPKSSISTGLVDYILPPEKMPQALINYVEHPFVSKKKTIEDIIDQEEEQLTKIMVVLRDYIGIDFSFYKENTIIRRLEKRLSINRYDNLKEYIRFLLDSDKEKDTLYRDLLIGVTRFFRDTKAFDFIQENIIKQLHESTGNKPIRIWSAGCSTGEEAYSIAMLFKEYMDANDIQKDLKIFATDIDKHAIAFAGAGNYPESIVSDIPPKYLAKYFTKSEDGYQINEEIRQLVIFASHNVLKDPPFSKIDFISCRNLFIYFKTDIQLRVLSMFYFSLNPHGYMLMGSSESLGSMSEAFNTIDSRLKIYKYRKGYNPPLSKELPLPQLLKIETNVEKLYRPRIIDNSTIDIISEAVYNKFVPPSIIIDDNYKIIQLINDVNKFLNFPKGKFTQNLLELLNDSLKLTVSSLLRKLRKDRAEVIFQNVKEIEGFENQKINIEGVSIDDLRGKKSYFLLSFHIINVKPEKEKKIQKIDVEDLSQDRMSELEQELQFTKENLQATVEELETSNEELQASNEELVASNEELQSTNEELQSVNEELYTVNSEYQQKIEELTKLNSDINNLLKNTNIGTLYLDRKLCIRKYTPTVSQITNILSSDIGRPIYHISFGDFYTDFLHDLEQVIDDLQPIEREIKFKEIFYLVKIMPYRTAENAADGIIVIFVDITSLKQAEDQVERLDIRLKEAMTIGQMAWWEMDLATGKVKYEDKKALMLGYMPNEFPDNYEDMCKLIHPEDYQQTMDAMKQHLEGKRSLYEATYRMKTKDGGWKWYQDRGGVVKRDGNKKPEKVSGVVIDVTEQQKSEYERERNWDLLHKVMKHSPVAETMVNNEGQIIFSNKQAEALFGITKKQIENRTYDDSKWEITDLDGKEIPVEKLPFSIIKKTKQPLYGYEHYIRINKGEKKHLKINGSPVLTENNEIEGIVFTLEEIES